MSKIITAIALSLSVILLSPVFAKVTKLQVHCPTVDQVHHAVDRLDTVTKLYDVFTVYDTDYAIKDELTNTVWHLETQVQASSLDEAYVIGKKAILSVTRSESELVSDISEFSDEHYFKCRYFNEAGLLVAEMHSYYSDTGADSSFGMTLANKTKCH